MPHKHKRKHGEHDAADFNLPPTARAAALPVNKPKAVVTNDDDDSQPKRSNKRRKPNKSNTAQPVNMVDDTPKQFTRLMAFTQGKKLRRGLDDGIKQPKEKKSRKPPTPTTTDEPPTTKNGTHKAESTKTPQPPPSLKIQPGERLGDFALRVDQSLPLSTVPKHSTRAPTVTGVKEKTYLTKHNKKLARMQAQWREEEAKLREKEEARDEERVDQREEDGLLWMGVQEARAGRKGKKKRGGGREGDIWAEVERRRRDGGDGGDVGGGRDRERGLNVKTAVQAPPVLRGVKNIFKEKVGGGAGRRVALQE